MPRLEPNESRIRISWCPNKIIIFIFLSFTNEIFKPIARRLPQIEPNEIFAEVISYDTSYFTSKVELL